MQRTKAELLDGRRNVAWWRFYYQMTAQYHAERLIAACAAIQSSQDPKTWALVLPGHLTRLRRGYNAIRCAFDYGLDQAGGGTGAEWLTRAWAEMTFAAIAIGCTSVYLACAGDPKAYEPTKSRVTVLNQIEWSNQRERLLSVASPKYASPAGPPLEPSVFATIFTSQPDPWNVAIDTLANLEKVDINVRFNKMDQIRRWAYFLAVAVAQRQK